VRRAATVIRHALAGACEPLGLPATPPPAAVESVLTDWWLRNRRPA